MRGWLIIPAAVLILGIALYTLGMIDVLVALGIGFAAGWVVKSMRDRGRA